MAKANSFLVNENTLTKDTAIINSFTDWHIFENYFIKNRKKLEESSKIVEIDARYDYRPDLLSFDLYKEEFYYPVILIVNNIGSMLQFKSEFLNNKCKVPSLDTITKLINEARSIEKEKGN